LYFSASVSCYEYVRHGQPIKISIVQWVRCSFFVYSQRRNPQAILSDRRVVFTAVLHPQNYRSSSTADLRIVYPSHPVLPRLVQDLPYSSPQVCRFLLKVAKQEDCFKFSIWRSTKKG